jgi:hypothetical protein
MKSLEEFIEHPDRYEKEFKVGNNDVVVSVYKDEITHESEVIVAFVLDNLEKIVSDSLAYIDKQKSQYEISFIDDFSDPQVFVGEDNFSIYWSSENRKGDGGIKLCSRKIMYNSGKWLINNPSEVPPIKRDCKLNCVTAHCSIPLIIKEKDHAQKQQAHCT